MGIESDKLVFDYLSRIGDLAHSTPMTAAERARLVTGLRGEIDRMRAEEGGAESKAAVKKILARLGKPEEVVAARGSGTSGGAGGSGGSSGSTGSYGSSAGSGSSGASGFSRSSGAGNEGQYVHRPSGEGSGSSGGSRSGGDRLVKRPKISLRKRPPEPPPTPAPTASYGAGSPHLAGMDELGPDESDPDWWRVDPTPYGDGGGSRTFGEQVPGFVGGIELPELLKPPPGGGEEDAARPGGAGPRSTVPAARKAPDDEGGEAAPGEGAGEGTGAAGRARRLLPGRVRLGASGPRVGGVVELAAAAVLVGGALAGSLIALGVGWLAAWWSPRLSRTEAKWAAAGMPGLVAAGTAVWLWGRTEGRWGEPIAQGGKELGRALTEAGPVVLRVAAVASALFLVWRARRPKP